MTVIHILKDGTIKNDISGHVVQLDDLEPLYRILEAINDNLGGFENEQI